MRQSQGWRSPGRQAWRAVTAFGSSAHRMPRRPVACCGRLQHCIKRSASAPSSTSPAFPNFERAKLRGRGYQGRMRKCNCSGACGSQDDGLSRREFIGWVGAGTATALLPSSAWADFELPSEELARWKKDLLGPAAPRLYKSGLHTDARLHLGGIGTGNVEIGSDGQFTTWQLFNTLRDGNVPLHFAVRCGQTARLLQTQGGPDWPRAKQIEMTGEYPLATLRFVEPDLPVNVALTAFTPFAPLDTELSSWPLAGLVFRLHNPTDQAQTVSLAAFLQNPVGYDANGRNDGVRHPNFGKNVNEVLKEPACAGLFLRAEPGAKAQLDRPVHLITLANMGALNTPPPDRPAALTLEVLGKAPLAAGKVSNPERTVIWLEDAPADLSEPTLRAARDLVKAGAMLVFSGKNQPLVSGHAGLIGDPAQAQATRKPDILFEDFEHGYGKWKKEGQAFGDKPAGGTLPNQQAVSGFLGQGLVNTFLNGDDTTGRLISPDFTIERNYIRFLIGGGARRTTQLRLLVNGKAVRSASGKDNERLEGASWDVRQFLGQTAHLEIIDNQQGPWGHINVDQIEFCDAPANAAVLALLQEVLPAQPADARPESGVNLAAYQPREGATATTTRDQRRAISRPLGKGKVTFVPQAVLDPAQAGVPHARQQAYALLCELAGANYQPCEGIPAEAPGFGSLALAALAGTTTVLPAFTDWAEAWQSFTAEGRFTPLEQARNSAPSAMGQTANGAVASTVSVPAGQTVEMPFLLTWHYPNKYNSGGVWMGCHYATRWPDARAVLRDATARFPQLREKTQRFRETFYDSTLPYWMLDCVTSQASIIRHIGVVFRIANGDIYGWEGSNGCCQPTCTHVWGYEQTLAYLFPDLERDMRRIDFKHQQRPDGGVNNRTDVPSPARPTGEQPFADGHASCILKAYREALNHPDDSFLREYWPHIRRGVDYLIGRDAASHAGQAAGYLEDDQWNTYDEALHGVTTFISAYYLAALRAGEEWARRMNDRATADRFHEVFLKGQRKLMELCWNGEYFQQHLPDYMKRGGEVGPGCMADQLIGQWWAHQLGLGYLLPKENVVTALKSVFKYNWKSDLTGWRHIPRAFAGARDKGLIICTWPKGGRPGHVMLYSDEVWTGIEYQVASHLIYEGMVEEGFAVIKGARDRYDGLPRPPIGRNPWNEIECGGHYARALSSYSLLLAASGFAYDAPAQALRFAPLHTPANFKSFFCGATAWGSLRQTRGGATRQTSQITVVEGKLALATLALALPEKPAAVRVRAGQRRLEATLTSSGEQVKVQLAAPLVLNAGETLVIELS